MSAGAVGVSSIQASNSRFLDLIGRGANGAFVQALCVYDDLAQEAVKSRLQASLPGAYGIVIICQSLSVTSR